MPEPSPEAVEALQRAAEGDEDSLVRKLAGEALESLGAAP